MRGCNKYASFKNPGDRLSSHCFEHKSPSMINKSNITCGIDGCNNRATFGFSTYKTRCREHKLKNMHSKTSTVCKHEGCFKRALYGDRFALYCSTHNIYNMSRVYVKICAHPGCKTSPSFNFRESGTSLYCNIHKKPGMINTTRPVCMTPNCNNQATYSYVGESSLIYCAIHKRGGMLNIYEKSIKNNMITVADDDGDKIEFLENTKKDDDYIPKRRRVSDDK